MSEIDAYAAGLFDGEGHIAIAHKPDRGGSYKNRSGYARYWLFVSMSQNGREAIDFLSTHYGGSQRFLIGKRGYDRGYYQRWNWVLSTKSAANFLRKIQPYCLTKAEEIKIALAFQDTINANTGRSPIPASVTAFRKECFDKIRTLRKIQPDNSQVEDWFMNGTTKKWMRDHGVQ